MANWLTNIRKGTPHFSTTPSTTAAITNLKANKINIRPIDSVFELMNYQNVNNDIKVNGKFFREQQLNFRAGNVRQAFRELGVLNNVRAVDESALKSNIRTISPDIDIGKYKDNLSQAKIRHGDLDVTARTGAELEAKLSPASKIKFNNAMKKLIIGSATVAGIFLIYEVTSSIYDGMVEATNRRNGCFVTSKVNGRTTSCKLTSRSCNTEATTSACQNNILALLNSNIFLMVTYAKTNDGDSVAKAIETQTNIKVKDSTIAELFSVPDNVDKLTEFLKETYNTGNEPWTYCPDIKAARCTACDPSAQVTTIDYVDTSPIAPNATLTCIQNTTILEGLIDLSTGLGIKIFDAISDSVSQNSGSLSNGYAIAIIVIILLIIVGVSIFLQLKKGKAKEAVVSIQTPNQGTIKR